MGVYIKGVTVKELMKVLICSTEFMPDGFEIVQTHNVGDVVSRSYLLAEYDRLHKGPSGTARKIIEEAPSVEQWIPCSERLPDKTKANYWVCTDSGYQYECRWTNINPIWSDLITDWHWNIYDTPQFSQVVAWMPLPEPYTERKDDE